MKTIQCPRCKEEVSVDIRRAVDEHGEVFVYSHCGFQFRYAPNG